MRNYRVGKNGVIKSLYRRNVSISARLPKDIYDIITEYDGKKFTEKLINLIFDYKEFYDLKKPDQKM